VRAETLDFLAAHRAERVGPLTEILVETISRENPAYRGTGVVPPVDLHRSCQANITRVLELLALAVSGGQDGRGESYFDAARATGGRRAEQGLHLDVVLRSFRIGGRLIWDDLNEQAGDRLPAEELRELGSRLWVVVDESSAQVAAAYHEAEAATVRADAQMRAELWEALLAGRLRPGSSETEAARVLGLPSDAALLVVVADGPAPGRVEAALAVGGTASSWTRRGRGSVGVVAVPARTDPRVAGRGLARLWGEASEVRAGVAVVARLAEVEQGHVEAGLALRAAAGRPGAPVLDDVLPGALLLTAPTLSARLVDQRLGPVLGLPATERDLLLETLEAWVATAGSTTATAAALHCHRNTVINRVRRLAGLLGEDLGGPPPVELALALLAHRLACR
jgi:hypothetical protein